MKHEEILFKAREYREGLLDAKTKVSVDRHLKGCPECRELYSRWRSAEPSPGFTEAVMDDLTRLVVLDPQRRPQEPLWVRFQWWGAVAAVLLVGLVFYRPERDWVNADRSFAWLGSASTQGPTPLGRDAMKEVRHE